jgi:hypothetical protein
METQLCYWYNFFVRLEDAFNVVTAVVVAIIDKFNEML